MARTDPDLELAIERLLDADSQAPDWTIAAGLLVRRPQELDALRVVADVAASCQRLHATAPTPAPQLFRWGHLQVRAQIASGASAKVYRAYDPALGIDVALKLHCAAPHSPPAGRFLDEARHLARTRQRNIVGVYGAAVHDGRAGIWCEWIDGHSLAELLLDQGRFAAVEAIYIGIELCNALAALHGAGMLHGDVKPGNVLRERGGRIVLVDLGAGGMPQAVNAASADYGTPSYLPPEVLNGAERRPEQDLYALGRLIETLLDSSADTQSTGAIAPLLQRVLARATATDPAQRYSSAQQMQRDLAAVLAAIGGAAPAKQTRRGFLIGLAAVCALGLVVLLAPRLAPVPWRSDLQLLRRTDTGVAPLSDGATLATGDRLVLEIQSNRPTHVYVFNEDANGALHVLFPVHGLALVNPLPAQDSLRLPGRQGNRELSWEITGSGQREEFLVVLASAPLTKLEQRLAQLDAVPLDPTERGVGRIRAELPGGITLHGTQLNALLAELGPELTDADRVRIHAYRFNETSTAP
jgi:eukaryotic-like serine/threonine-protein kinase